MFHMKHFAEQTAKNRGNIRKNHEANEEREDIDVKKLLVVFLAIALLLSAGCTKTKPAASGDTAPASTAPIETTAPKTEPAATAAAPETETPAPETEPVRSTEALEPVDPWSLLGSGGYEAGAYTDELGNEYSYSYDLPVLLAETEGAKAINEALDGRFGAAVRDEKANMERKLSLGIGSIGYHGVVWEDVLTLVVTAHGYNDDWTDYGVYSYEASTGRWLTTPMILEKMGVSEEVFLEDCRAIFQYRFAEKYSELTEEARAQTGYTEALERQTAEEYVNLDLAVYPEEGELMVVAPILCLAGPDFVYEVLSFGLNAEG